MGEVIGTPRSLGPPAARCVYSFTAQLNEVRARPSLPITSVSQFATPQAVPLRNPRIPLSKAR